MSKNNQNREIPFFTSWKGWYRLVLFILLAEIIMFYLITILLE